MLFKKLLKRQEPALAKSAKAPATRAAKPASEAVISLPERRNFPRAMPVPEVQEQDWAAWEDVTQEKTGDKQV